MLMNWRKWCRLCAKCDGSDIDLFIKFESESNLTEIVQKYFNLSITEDDGGSRTICKNCYNFIIKLNKFGENCAKIELMYQELLYGQLNAEIKENDIQEIRNKFIFNNCIENTLEDVKVINDQLVCAMLNEEPNYFNENTTNRTELKTNIDIKNNFIDETKLDLANELRNFLDTNPSEDVKKKKKRKTISTKNKKQEEDLLENFEPIKCDTCQKEFASKHSLKSHLRTVHGPKDVLYSCSKCPKQFHMKKSAKRHELVHLPPELKLIYPCSYCDKKFSKTSTVQAHIKAIHHREKPFICEECGKSFCTKPALKEHQIVHSDEKPFSCKFCPQKFKNLPRLKVHEQIHSDTKYICKECGLQLNTKQTLRRHMVVHSDVKSFKCQYCGNEYKRSKTLKNHLIVHTGLKPYVCPFCGKTFASGSNCRSHKKNAHPNELAAAEGKGYMPIVENIPKLEELQPKIIPQHNPYQIPINKIDSLI